MHAWVQVVGEMVGPPEVHEVPEVARVTGGIRGSLVPAEPVQSGVVAVRIVVAPLQQTLSQSLHIQSISTLALPVEGPIQP